MINLDNLDYPQLLALGRAFGECRFPEKEFDDEIWISPYVIEMHCDVMSAQRRWLAERQDVRRLEKLDTFLTWWPDPTTNRLEAIFVRRFAARDAYADYVLSGGPARVQELLRPYVLSDEDCQRIIDRIASLRA